ncbi:hypothetical protein SAMN05216178_2051 [Pseudomonas saponiphila]|uniref:Uncharacterized protein n=1 Tax=Pseudomonas saponiphila TaxID=556534 RepID=A0A1H4LT88_9PSED|nr:hypothetical protein [Pseudomonas saponiphila]SEB73412.1 hypothetical protein SAMN05216178_2051 [Pseudomonas saponiphila]
MRSDQLDRMQNLAEDLAEVVIQEADPKQWPGAGKLLADLTKDERGDRYWCKKNAAATMTLLVKVMNICGTLNRAGAPAPNEEEEGMDKDIARAEQEAVALLEKAQQGGHVH